MRKGFAVVALAALLLTGCVEPTAEVTPTASAGEPVFASEEEALAAAEEVLDKYVFATDLMSTSGGEDLTGFDGILTANQLADEKEQAEDLNSEGLHLVGSHAYTGLTLQQLDQTQPPEVYMQVYLCLDLSNVSYVDANGNDTSANDHSLASPIEAVLVNTAEDPTVLLIEDVRRWTGDDFCS